MNRVILLIADGDLRRWADKFGLDQENDELLNGLLEDDDYNTITVRAGRCPCGA